MSDRKVDVEELKRRIAGTENEMLGMLREMLSIDSYTYKKDGVDRIVGIAEREFGKIGFATERFRSGGACAGDTLGAVLGGKEGALMLSLHADMARPLTGKENHAIRDGKIFYPGVSDMKASIVSAIFALRVLQELDLLEGPLTLVLSGDEEQGSPTARPRIEAFAEKSRAFVGLEAARVNGAFVHERRGGAYFSVGYRGRSSHSGSQQSVGLSAVEEVAHKILELHALSDLKAGVGVNVGHISGGTSLGNAVAGEARLKVDIKFPDMATGEKLCEKARAICIRTEDPALKVDFSGGISFFPVKPTDASMKMVATVIGCAKDLGFPLESTATGGEADAGFAATLGIPTIDGLGPVGGGHHSEDEYLEVPTLTERTALLALSLLRLD